MPVRRRLASKQEHKVAWHDIARFVSRAIRTIPKTRRGPCASAALPTSFRSRPETEDRATGKIVNGLNIHQTVKNHVADDFHPKSAQKDLAPGFWIQVFDDGSGSAFRNFAEQFLKSAPNFH
jgi:hypothetical protein